VVQKRGGRKDDLRRGTGREDKENVLCCCEKARVFFQIRVRFWVGDSPFWEFCLHYQVHITKTNVKKLSSTAKNSLWRQKKNTHNKDMVFYHEILNKLYGASEKACFLECRPNSRGSESGTVVRRSSRTGLILIMTKILRSLRCKNGANFNLKKHNARKPSGTF
jgi:hypothetical protein